MKRHVQKLYILLLLLMLTACAPPYETRVSGIRSSLSAGDLRGAANGALTLLETEVSAEAASLLAEAMEGLYASADPASFLSDPLVGNAQDALQLYSAADKRLTELVETAKGLILTGTGSYEEALPHLKKSTRPEAVKAAANCEDILRRQKTLAEAERLADENDFEGAITLLSSFSGSECKTLIDDYTVRQEEYLDGLTEYYRTRFCAGAWYTVLSDERILFAGDSRYDLGELPEKACEVYPGLAAPVFLTSDGTLHLFSDSFGQGQELTATHIRSAAAGVIHLLLLRNDGSVVTLGASNEDLAAAGLWTDITAVAAGSVHSLGLTKDGTVLAAGENTSGQCETEDWTGITSIAAGAVHSAGLKSDGTVICCGDNSCGQCDTADWKDVNHLVCGPFCTVGLTSERKLLYAGSSSYGFDKMTELEGVIAVAPGSFHASVMLRDGTVVFFGSNDNGQQDLNGSPAFSAVQNTPSKGSLPSGELIYVGHNRHGPWLYISRSGIVLITEDDTFGLGANRADLISAAGTLPEGIFSGGGIEPGASLPGPRIARQNHAVFAVSGDYFTYTGNANGVQIRRGVIRDDGRKTRSVAFYPDGSMRLIDSSVVRADDLVAAGVRDVWAFGPVLVQDSMLYDFSRNSLARGSPTLRCCIGTLGRNHHVILTTGSGTIGEVAGLMLSYGCSDAYNLDGGRSVSMVFMGEAINRTQFDSYGTRNLRDMIAFLYSDSVPGENDPYTNRKY